MEAAAYDDQICIYSAGSQCTCICITRAQTARMDNRVTRGRLEQVQHTEGIWG